MRLAKAIVFCLCLTPAAILGWKFYQAYFQGQSVLGANPVEAITHETGNWALRLLLTTLTITPLRKLANMPQLIRFRRMLGLFAFFYGTLHFMTYLWLDQSFDWAGMLKDVSKRPFITAGFTAFVLMVPLALTSTSWSIRQLGGKGWQALHRLVYFSALAAVIHYYWLVKSDVRLPLLYAGILVVLMLYRTIVWLRPVKPKPAPRLA